MVSKKSNVVGLSRRRETREQVLERLFSEHGDALRAFLRVRMSSHADADTEDIAQEVFIRLARMDELETRLSPSNDSNRSFMVAVANNLVLDFEKKKRVRYRYAQSEQAQAHEDDSIQLGTPESISESREQLERMRDVIMNLHPCSRKAFILNRFKFKSYREISVEMGVSVKQIEKYMKRALTQIREAAAEFKGNGPQT